jgi:hypothetical protein
MDFIFGHEDFSVVVKSRSQPPKPWRWEIYRAGRKSPIQSSEVYFETVAEAKRAGKKALQLFLSEYHVSNQS